MGKSLQELWKENEEERQRILGYLLSEGEDLLWQGQVSEKVYRKARKMLNLSVLWVLGIPFIVGIVAGIILSVWTGNVKFLFILWLLVPTISLLFFWPFLFLGIITTNAEEYEYYITSERILILNYGWLPSTIIYTLNYEDLEEVIITYRFSKFIEFFILRDNKQTRHIRQIEFFSDLLETQPQQHFFVLEGNSLCYSENHPIGNKLVFLCLEDWQLLKDILRKYIPEKL